MFVDSHCHLNYLDCPSDAIARARERDVETILCIGVEEERFAEVLQCTRNYAHVWASAGEHPGNTTGRPTWVREHLDDPKVVAVGETGLDYFHVESSAARAKQRAGFNYQMGLADECGLPVVIHTRDAIEDTLDIMKSYPEVVGVLHCFTESWEMANTALEMGYYISLSGIVTFKTAGELREVAQKIPTERLLIETDAPWLAPVPNRGKQNEPAYLADTARFLAELRQESLDELAGNTRKNFFDLFRRAVPG